ncbi:beta-galactosidase, partial [Nonomuraea fuscirosea]
MADRPFRWLRRPAASPRGLSYGADYNPEQWPPHIWRQDVEAMRRAGVTIVSLAIFSWARLQPAADRWTFEWLDAERSFLVSLVADLHDAGLDDPCWRLAHLLAPYLERHRFLDDWRVVSGRALESARRSADDRSEALVLLDLGDLHLAEREWDLAHERLRLALGMFLRQGRTRDVNHARRRLGRVHLE